MGHEAKHEETGVSDDWYRNSDWSEDIESRFFEKLARSRSQKPSYLYIQAHSLQETHPSKCLELIEQWAELDCNFRTAEIHCVKGRALWTLGDLVRASQAYKVALDWDAKRPSKSWAHQEYPQFVALGKLTKEYDLAFDTIEASGADASNTFPFVRHPWNASAAMIFERLGDREGAIELAQIALRAWEAIPSEYKPEGDMSLFSKAVLEAVTRIAKGDVQCN